MYNVKQCQNITVIGVENIQPIVEKHFGNIKIKKQKHNEMEHHYHVAVFLFDVRHELFYLRTVCRSVSYELLFLYLSPSALSFLCLTKLNTEAL